LAHAVVVVVGVFGYFVLKIGVRDERNVVGVFIVEGVIGCDDGDVV
jgi:hypothetical protein